jgi:protocatechuate 3,4-dioxygenase beta subunit
LFAGVCVLLLIVSSKTADAQVLNGPIVGNVADGSGGVVPGATVTITHDRTKATRETVTDANGRYQFPTIQSGTSGFTTKGGLL